MDGSVESNNEDRILDTPEETFLELEGVSWISTY